MSEQEIQKDPETGKPSINNDAEHDDEYRDKKIQLQKLIDDPDGWLGYDDNNCGWKAKIREDGTQIWLSSYNKIIHSAGSNPPSLLCKTGLKLLKPGSRLHERYIKDMKDPNTESIIKSVIPRYIVIGSAPYLLGIVIKNFLLNYNIYLKSEEITLLMEAFEYGEQIPEVHELLCAMAYHIPIRYNTVGDVILHCLLGVKIFLRFDTYDFYMSTVCFLEKYGKQKEATDILTLASELGQFHIAQWVYKKWENSMKWALQELDLVDDDAMHDINKWI